VWWVLGLLGLHYDLNQPFRIFPSVWIAALQPETSSRQIPDAVDVKEFVCYLFDCFFGI
jgi:hypothetical protein